MIDYLILLSCIILCEYYCMYVLRFALGDKQDMHLIYFSISNVSLISQSLRSKDSEF